MTPSLNDTIETLRQETLAVLTEISQRAVAFELPPDEGLAHYYQQLQGNQYTVLVVGEAKRGKSSFVNALLGRALLPTDVDVATSQVFRVSKSEREGYRLRFADGSAQPISAADLPKYGSQVLADAGELPRLDQIINWIEVDVPAQFLPDGVSLLDTPGLGALYAGHSQITQRFIP
jgi:GTPase SAR1 family protein